jgi:hypothetical protein
MVRTPPDAVRPVGDDGGTGSGGGGALCSVVNCELNNVDSAFPARSFAEVVSLIAKDVE